MEILMKRVGKPLEFISTNRKYRCDVAQDVLRGEITYVQVSPRLWMCVASECSSEEFNFLFPPIGEYPIQIIEGDAAFIKTSVPDFSRALYDLEIESITDAEYAMLQEILSMGGQNLIANEFNK